MNEVPSCCKELWKKVHQHEETISQLVKIIATLNKRVNKSKSPTNKTYIS